MQTEDEALCKRVDEAKASAEQQGLPRDEDRSEAK